MTKKFVEKRSNYVLDQANLADQEDLNNYHTTSQKPRKSRRQVTKHPSSTMAMNDIFEGQPTLITIKSPQGNRLN